MKELYPYNNLYLLRSSINLDRNFFKDSLSEIPNIVLEFTGNLGTLRQFEQDLKEEESDCQTSYCCHYHLYARDYKEGQVLENIFTLIRFWKEMGFHIQYQSENDHLRVFAS